MPTDRPNSRLSADVELALLMVDQVGVYVAARFLARRGAGFGLICRVLAEPARRRAVVASAPAPTPPAPLEQRPAA